MADTTDTPSLQQLTSMSPKGTGFKDFQSFMQPFNQNAERAAKEKSQMEGEKEAFAAQQQSVGAEQKAGLLDSTNKSMADLPQRGQMKEVTEAMGKPFVPTQDNAKDLATLFSLINVVGFAIGRGGKNNSVQALSAMNGMAEGYQKGRDDLYKKEKATFDENMKQLKTKFDTLNTELKDGMDLLARDYEAGKLKIDATLSKQSASFLQDMAHKYGYARMYEYYTDAQKSAQKMWDEYSKIQDRAQTHEMERQRLEIEKQKLQKMGGGSDRFGFNEIMATASNEAAASMRNIMGLTVDSSAGYFGGKQASSLFTAPADAFTNELTSESTQRYNAEASKLSFNLSQLMKGGRSVSVNEVAVMDGILKIREGDSLETAATKLAEARQIAERAMEVRIQSNSTPPALKEIYKQNLDTIKQVIPFTVDDINKFVQQKNGDETFGQSLETRYQPKDSSEHPEDIQNLLSKYKGVK